ncbi:hypothetical protein Tco_0710343 [Tanacetum coccineum]
MVATRLHQPWRAILSVLNSCLTGKDSSWDTIRLPILHILCGIIHSANLDFASLIWDEFKWQTIEKLSRQSKMSNLLYTRFTKLIIDYLLSLNKSIPRRLDSMLHSSQDDHPITKLLSTINSEYKFIIEVLDAMISDAIKKKSGYKYYMAKKVESEKAKIVNEPKKQHICPIKSGRGKGFMCYGDQVANVPNKLKKDVVLSKTRSLTIAEEAVESKNETDDANEFDMDLSNDNPHGDDDNARYGVFMHNKSTATPNSTYLSLTVTSASEVPLGTQVDVLATKTLMQEMFLDENAHRIPSLPGKKIPYPTTTPQPNSLQAKAKKLMQKEKKNMRKFNFKKAAVQAKVMTEIKKLLPTHIPNAIANYVKPHLNTFLKLLNQIHVNKSNDTYTTHQQLYDTLYESIILDQDALDAHAVQSYFHKRSHDNQDLPNNREGENKKKRQKDVCKPSSRSSR